MKRLVICACGLALATIGFTTAHAQPYRAGFGINITRNAQYQPVWSVNPADIKHLGDSLGWGGAALCAKPYTVRLGHWVKQSVARSEPGTAFLCDTIFTYPTPSPRDSSYVVLTPNALALIQKDMYAMYGCYRDTVRILPPSRLTISFVLDPVTGLYYGNMKEANAAYPFRIGSPGQFFGTSYTGCPVTYACGGVSAGTDTVVVSRNFVLSHMGLFVPPSQWVRFTVLDTTRQIITNEKAIVYFGDPQLQWTFTRCHDRPTTITWYDIVDQWIDDGRDTTVYVDSCKIRCPRFSVDAITQRPDTTYSVDTVWTDIPVFETFTRTTPDCWKIYTIPDSFTVRFVTSGGSYIRRSRFDSLVAIYGKDSAAGRVYIIDSSRSVRVRYTTPMYDRTVAVGSEGYISSGGRLVTDQIYPCPGYADTVESHPNGWVHAVTIDVWSQKKDPVTGQSVNDTYMYTDTYYLRYAWLPYAALIDPWSTCGEALDVQPAPGKLHMQSGSCCSHDTTIYFMERSHIDRSIWVFGRYTYKVPDDLYHSCTYIVTDSVKVGYVFDHIDSTMHIQTVMLPDTTYTITIVDTCECRPAFELANGNPDLCKPIRFRMECSTIRPYLDLDGQTIVFPCQETGIFINNKYGRSFDGLVTLDVLDAVVNYFRSYCPPCIDSLRKVVADLGPRGDTLRRRLDTLTHRIDSLAGKIDSQARTIDTLKGRIESLEGKVPHCADATIGEGGTFTIMLSATPSHVSITYSGGWTPVAAPSYLWDGSTLTIKGDPTATITFCWWP